MGTALVKRTNTLPAPLGLDRASVFGNLLNKFKRLYHRSDRFINLLVGMPSYDKYVEHMQTRHPNREILSRKEFFKEALNARYNGGFTRCC
ncbi:DUF466 domain-containing protein [Campylobacter sp. MIT 97-5078]|nr:DUF466 domain-containing protein [Campylobacter sp. MIT 97-5078]